MLILRMGKRPTIALFILLLLLLPASFLRAQEALKQGDIPLADPETADRTAEEPPPQTPEEAQLLMEIKTSTIEELAAMARSLGVDEKGGKEDIARRLREHLKLPQPAPLEPGKEDSVITIESARGAQYFTLENINEDYARLTGTVIVNLKDGQTTHSIKARDVLFNKSRNTITASGDVEYVKKDGDTTETFRGRSITVDMNTWATVFVDGVSERTMSDSEAAYRFSGSLITRSADEVTIITDAEVSNAATDEPYWSITASKIWLLPGSDWAIAHAVLWVGEIPVLYFPYFYYPADEIVFHPVLGTRPRVGNFLQTTTYLIGRLKPDPEKSNSINKILGSGADMERVREGIFLRSTGKKNTEPNDLRLSVLLDGYTNLGFYAGTELEVPAMGYFDAWKLSAGVGYTRDIQKNGSSYSPLIEGESRWNRGQFFSYNIPLRYRFYTAGAMAGDMARFSWTLPFYGDPYVEIDFMDRAEEINFFDLLKPAEEEAEDETDHSLGSYQWQLSGSFTPKLPILNPVVSDFAIKSITSTMSFTTKLDPALSGNDYSPNRKFFFPDKFTPFSISASFAGTPFTLGVETTVSKLPIEVPDAPNKDSEDIDGILKYGEPRSPWATGETQTEADEGDPAFDLLLPPLTQTFDIPRFGGPRFFIDYTVSPSLTTEIKYLSEKWTTAADIDWNNREYIISNFNGSGNFGLNLTQNNTGIYNSAIKLSGSATWQDYSYMNKEASAFDTEAEIEQAKKRTDSQKAFTTSLEWTSSVKPFYFNDIWSASNVGYTAKGLFYKSVYDETSTAAEPKWDIVRGKWNKEDLETNQFFTSLSANLRDQVQTVSANLDMPPEDSKLSWNALFKLWFWESSIRNVINDPFKDYKRDPFYFTETLKAAEGYQFQQYNVYDPALDGFTNSTSTLTLGDFSSILTYTRSHSYTLTDSGWVMDTGEEKLIKHDFQAKFRHSFIWNDLWKSRISEFGFTVDSGLFFDLQRYTYSKFNFSFGFVMKINNFFDVSLSTTSENSVIFRYFQNLPIFDLPQDLPPGKQNNILHDLANSFRFDNEELRRQSGFKMKTFTLKLMHYMGDWTASYDWSLSPYLDSSGSGPPVYKFDNQISFLIKWIPISEIKNDITYSKEDITVK
ncbi:LPS-assembly protein LptD [Breznakiellaceae bacterium SP9]